MTKVWVAIVLVLVILVGLFWAGSSSDLEKDYTITSTDALNVSEILTSCASSVSPHDGTEFYGVYQGQVFICSEVQTFDPTDYGYYSTVANFRYKDLPGPLSMIGDVQYETIESLDGYSIRYRAKVDDTHILAEFHTVSDESRKITKDEEFLAEVEKLLSTISI